MIEEYIQSLKNEFEKAGHLQTAEQQKAYIKNKFEHYGLKSKLRREVQKPFFDKDFLPTKKEAFEIITILWQSPYRDLHYFAQELAFKYIKKDSEESDIIFYENLIINQSWWDTVDFIASSMIGSYFKKYPWQIYPYIEKWLKSNNLWLQRSCLIFQLKYKDQLNEKLLEDTISQLLGSKEFFINKAIGWSLRQHSRINPDWVKDMTEKYPLSNLSKKEALRLIS